MPTAATQKRRALAKVRIAKGRRSLASGRRRPVPTPKVRQLKTVVSPGPRPPAELVPFKKGQVSLRARAGLFAKQKRVRSIIGRERLKGRPKELKQFAGAVQFEVLQERSVNSSWVRMIHLIMYNGKPALGVTFHSGVTVLYTTTAVNDYKRMADSASKGKFIWRALYHGRPGQGAPYIVIGF